MRKICLILTLVFATLVTANAQERRLALADGVKPHKGIDRIYRDFSESYRTFDFEKVADLYTEDVAYLSPSRNIVFGRDEVLSNFRGFFNRVKESERSMTISFHILKRQVSGDFGYDVGIFDLAYTTDGKIVTEAKGKFVVVTVKDKDGKWRFAVDGYSDLSSND